MKKYIAVFTALLMTLGCLTALPAAADEVAVWDGTSDTSWYNTKGVTFEISTAAQLAGLADIVNGDATVKRDNFAGKTVKLTADICLNTCEGEVKDFLIFPPANSVWNPIGKYSDGDKNDYVFSGTFDGNYHVISGLYLYEWNIDSIVGWYKGLFGCVENGTVKNLGVVKSCIRGYNGASPLVAYAKNATVENCFVAEAILYGNAMLGGIVGLSEGSTIRNCFTTDAQFGDAYKWGFTGVASVVGRMAGKLENCYSADIETPSDHKGVQGETGFKPKNCYYEASADGSKADYNGLAKSTDSMKSAEFVNLLNSNAGADDVWQADLENVNDGFPILCRFDYTLLKKAETPVTTEEEETTDETEPESDDTEDDTDSSDTTEAAESESENNDTADGTTSGSPVIWILVGVAAAVLIVAIVIILIKRKK